MRPATDSCIQTYTGVNFTFADPQPEQIVFEDIAHSLSMQCRYTGHCGFFYSIAEHSVLIATWILSKTGNKRLAIEGLLHDAVETYLVDVPRPIKPHLEPQYQELEKGLESVMARKFNLALPWNEFVKEGDIRICNDEYNALFRSRIGECQWTLPLKEPLGVNISGWPPAMGKVIFTETFRDLTKGG